jgi:hypothetical protein
VAHLDDASSRSARRFLESTAAAERLSRITPLARVTEPARLKPILLLALVVGLQSADRGTVGALVVSLKESLMAGALADRTVPVRLLWMALLVCSTSMALSAIAPNYGWLLACRVGLGAGMAVSGPVVASLIGDYFSPGERGRVYGLVLAGAGTCTAVGLLVTGELGALSWRLGFRWQAVVGFALAVAVATMLREPPRGGHRRRGERADNPGSHQCTDCGGRGGISCSRGVHPSDAARRQPAASAGVRVSCRDRIRRREPAPQRGEAGHRRFPAVGDGRSGAEHAVVDIHRVGAGDIRRRRNGDGH